MKAKMFLIPLLSVFLVGCESHSTPTPPSSQNRTMTTTFPSNTNTTSTTSTFSTDKTERTNVPSSTTMTSEDADNTGRNIRDRGSQTVTSFDQSESEPDRAITVNIRRALVSDPSLSTNAKNIKVITVNGTVTIRGPVNTPQEKALIEQILSRVSGIQRVDNQLEVLHQASR